jgi:hypothetical protein
MMNFAPAAAAAFAPDPRRPRPRAALPTTSSTAAAPPPPPPRPASSSSTSPTASRPQPGRRALAVAPHRRRDLDFTLQDSARAAGAAPPTASSSTASPWAPPTGQPPRRRQEAPHRRGRRQRRVHRPATSPAPSAQSAPFRHLYLGAMANAGNASGDKHISYPSGRPDDHPRGRPLRRLPAALWAGGIPGHGGGDPRSRPPPGQRHRHRPRRPATTYAPASARSSAPSSTCTWSPCARSSSASGADRAGPGGSTCDDPSVDFSGVTVRPLRPRANSPPSSAPRSTSWSRPWPAASPASACSSPRTTRASSS